MMPTTRVPFNGPPPDELMWDGTMQLFFWQNNNVRAYRMGRQTVKKPNRNKKMNIFVEEINIRMLLFLKLHLAYVIQPLFFWVKPFFVQLLCWCGFFSIHNQCTTKKGRRLGQKIDTNFLAIFQLEFNEMKINLVLKWFKWTMSHDSGKYEQRPKKTPKC